MSPDRINGKGGDRPVVFLNARVIDPSVLSVRPAPLDVELTGPLTRGMTVADLRAPVPPGCTTQVAVGIDRERFWDLVVDAVERIGDGGA